MKISLKRINLIWIPLVLVFPAFSFSYIWRDSNIRIDDDIIIGIFKVSGMLFGIIQFLINQRHTVPPTEQKPSNKLHSRLYHLFIKIKPVLYPICALIFFGYLIAGLFYDQLLIDPLTLVLCAIIIIIPAIFMPLMVALNMNPTFSPIYTLVYAYVLTGFFSSYVLLGSICNLYSYVKSLPTKNNRELTAGAEDVKLKSLSVKYI